jgi:hypothetical protein
LRRHPDDARHAVDAGASAISVSNHGGNNLDGTPAAIRMLPGIDETLVGLGRGSIQELARPDVLVPEGFAQAAAVPTG